MLEELYSLEPLSSPHYNSLAKKAFNEQSEVWPDPEHCQCQHSFIVLMNSLREEGELSFLEHCY